MIRALQFVGLAVAAVALASILQVLVVRMITPPWTLRMLEVAQETGAWPERRVRSLGRLGDPGPRAFVASEDARFFLHGGFDNRAICEAVRDASKGGRLRGASTISQQVAKNVFLWNGRSWRRKVLEVWYTWWLEVLVPKERILELYVNVAETGPGVFGLEAGARHHFGKPAAKLTRAEAGRIAGVLPSPGRAIGGKAAWSRATWIAEHPAPFPGDRLYPVIEKEFQARNQSLLGCFF